MSKKTKKKRQQKTFPWALVALGGAILVVAVFLLANAANSASDGTPNVSVEEQKIDLGYVKLGEYRSLNIKVTNTGDGTLRFKENPYIEVLEG